MKNNNIFTPPEQFHKKLIDKYGPNSSEAVLWHSAGLQCAAFADLLQYISLQDGFSVLDVGAGKCDLYGFLESRIVVDSYVGVDRSVDLLKIGHSNYPNIKTIAGDYAEIDVESMVLFDLVIANGSLPYVKMYHGRKKQLAMFKQIVTKMFLQTRRYCAFNIYSPLLSKVTGDDPKSWFMIEGQELLELVSSLTPRFIIDHSSRSGYVNVILYHNVIV